MTKTKDLDTYAIVRLCQAVEELAEGNDGVEFCDWDQLLAVARFLEFQDFRNVFVKHAFQLLDHCL